MKGCRKILIAVKDADRVLTKGLDLAGQEGGWVTVLKVLPPYEGELDLTGVRNIRELIGNRVASAEQALNSKIQERRALAKVSVQEGDASESISRVAREEHCDIIVMGRAKKQGFWSWLLGDGVTRRVLSEAPCPVLFVEA